MGETGSAQGLLILGAGTFAEEVADLAREIAGFEIAGFVEGKDPTKVGEASVRTYWIDDIPKLASSVVGICALGTTRRDRMIDTASRAGLRFTTLVHPASHVSATSEIGIGCLIGPGAVIASHTTLGAHVLVNRGCLVGHHVSIGDFCTLSPGANIAGGCRLGYRVYVGMGAIILNGLRIGSRSVIGAGAVVTRDVPDGVQVMGIPARVTKEGIEGL